MIIFASLRSLFLRVMASLLSGLFTFLLIVLVIFLLGIFYISLIPQVFLMSLVVAHGIWWIVRAIVNYSQARD